MKLAVVVLVALALFAPGTASAHLVAKPKADTLAALAESQKTNLAHARYVARHGRGPHVAWHRKAVVWLEREHAETRAKLVVRLPVRDAICAAFGSYCAQAWEVALCEGGRPIPSVNASNGQFKGIFQMGERERATYGHGPTAYEQARAAWRYFVASGRDWSPWECKPW